MDVIVQDGIINGVITESKSGRQAILAKRVVDCTGDADIAYLCGVECTVVEKKDKLAVTTVFGCSGVDKQTFLKYTDTKKATYSDWGDSWVNDCKKESALQTPYLSVEFEKAKQTNDIPRQCILNGTWSSISDAGEATNLNVISIHSIDGTDVKDLTKAEIQGRGEAMHAIRALRKTTPGFENSKLRTFGMTIGIRDTRKIVAQYNMTSMDVLEQGRFEDSIGICPEFVDGYNILTLPTSGRYFQIPYGCLNPVGIDNLLVAGRCVGGDKISHAALRNMMACTITGQGAGIAAAISIKKNRTTNTTRVSDIQGELQRQNVRCA